MGPEQFRSYSAIDPGRSIQPAKRRGGRLAAAWLFLAAAFAGTKSAAAAPAALPSPRPNIVIILVDDAGFADPSCFGGAPQTPAFDRLAAQGLRFNNFNTASICTSTRAALLTGLNHHHAGFGTVTDLPGATPGYDGIWKDNVPSVATILRQNGYSTAAIGKWHNTPWQEINPAGPYTRWPTSLGFDYFYGFMQPGASSQWEPHSLYRDTTAVEARSGPGQLYYMTTDLTDEAIHWVQTHQAVAANKPYFLYFAPAAVHFPHHAASRWIEEYRGQFDQGWDRYREEVFARQKKLGVIPPNAELTPRPPEVTAWDSLSPDQKKVSAREMEVYAGYVAETDYEIGRLLEAVQTGPDGANTLIFYIFGDNGGSAFGDVPRGANLRQELQHLDEMGGPEHLNGLQKAWAWAVSTPFQRWKSYASHFGGTRNALVVSWPAHITHPGGLRTQFTHVNDVAPTLYELLGIEFPAVIDGRKTIPLDGVSFSQAFDDPDAPSRHKTQYFEMYGNRAIYHDGWVAAARHTHPRGGKEAGAPDDYNSDRWELYHVADDYSEAHDLAARFPDRLADLRALFDAEARRNDVYPLGDRVDDVWPGPGYASSSLPETVVYHAGLPRLLGIAAPNFTRGHHITADVVIPDEGASGILVAWGSRWSGFALYVKDERLVYEINNNAGAQTIITSDVAVPRGRVSLEFAYEQVTQKPGASRSSGTGRLLIDGKPAGTAAISINSYAARWGSFGVGQQFLTVTKAFDNPAPFTGTLSSVTVQLR